MSSNEARQPDPLPPKHSVLVVDDDVETVEILALVLEDEGFEVWKAHTAAEARATVARHRPELVLLDVMLPDADGRDLCHEFKTAEPTHDVFVILISGMAVGAQSRIKGLNLGADDYLTKPVQPQEIVARIRSFLRIREASDALRKANEFLEHRVLARTEELWQANQDLQRAAAESRALSSRLLETQERERRRLAHELHDEAGQALTVLKFSFDNIEEFAAQRAPETMAEGRAALTRLTQLIRNLWQELRPAMLEDFGLVPAVVWYCDRFTGSTRVKVDFQHEGVDARRFNRDIEVAAYRTIQEALTNVARHSGVREVRVVLWAGPDLLQVQVVDQGKGFDTTKGLSRDGSCGLVGMQERVRLLRGTWSVTSKPGAGVRILAEFPGADAAANEAAANGAAPIADFTTMDTRILRPSDFNSPAQP